MWIKRLLPLAVCTLLICFCVHQVQKVENRMQYLIPAPSSQQKAADPDAENMPPQPSALKQALARLQEFSSAWDGVIPSFAVSTDISGETLQGEGGQSVHAHLSGIYGDRTVLPQTFLLAGRHLYPEELEQGTASIVLDEPLALALFRVGDPIGRSVLIDDLPYQVVGVVRHRRMPGDSDAFGAQVPLLALDAQQKDMDVMTIWALSIPGAGSFAQFKNDMTLFQPGGNLYNLSKEQFRALLPVRITLCAAGILLSFTGFRMLGILQRRLKADYLRRLRSQFAVQLFPRLCLYILLVTAGFVALILFSYLITQRLLDVVYVFPEWVPAVPVEWQDISSTFWQNRAADSSMVELRSSQLLTLRFYHSALRTLCTVLCCLLLPFWGVMRQQMHQKYPKNPHGG